MQRDFVIDVIKPGSRALVSRRRTNGVTLTGDPKGRLRTITGLCIHTGPGTSHIGLTFTQPMVWTLCVETEHRTQQRTVYLCYRIGK